MHHLTCGISSLLRSVNLILSALLLVNLILHISPHHSRHAIVALAIYHPVFTARCYPVRGIATAKLSVCLSVRPSVRSSVHDGEVS